MLKSRLANSWANVGIWLANNGGPMLRLRANLQWPNVGCQRWPNAKIMVGPLMGLREIVIWGAAMVAMVFVNLTKNIKSSILKDFDE